MLESELTKLRILEKLKKLTKYVGGLKSRNFATSSPKLYAENLEKLLEITTNNLERLSASTYQNFENYLDQNLLEYCSFIERSTPSYIPWSFLNELEKICRASIEEGVGVVLKSDYLYNYSVHNINLTDHIILELKEYLGNLQEFDSHPFSKTRVFTIPLLEKSNAILHSALFHEIGHHHHSSFEQEHGVEEYVNALQEIFESRSTGGITEDDLFTFSNALLILKGAIREIYCDIYAYQYSGLSIIFALHYFYQKYPVLFSPDKENNYYPPFKFRIRVLCELADSDGTFNLFRSRTSTNLFNDSILSEISRIESFLDDKDDVRLIDSRPESLYAYRALKKIMPIIISHTRKAAIPEFQVAEKHQILFDKILDGIPPCEISGTPQQLVDILLSGWAAYFHSLDNDSHSLEEKIKNINFINSLILKAITQSNLLEKFQRIKNGHAK